MRTHLHVFPTFALGGAQRRLSALAAAADSWRHVIVALDGNTEADAAMGAARRSYEAVRTERSSGVSTRNLRRLAALMRRVRPALVSTYNWGAVEALLANRLLVRLPHIHHEDGFGAVEAVSEAPRRRAVRRLALSGRAHLVVPSFGLAERARRAWRVPPGRSHHIPNGVDLDRFTPGRDGRGPVVFLGALRPEKNLPRLLDAVRGAPFALDVVGGGAIRPALEAAAPPNVRFRGRTDAPEHVLRGARALALSSDTEQMPLVVLEAMAAGLPVVATDVGDTRRLVSEPNRPFVTPLGDEAAFRHALEVVASDEALGERIGAANRARAEACYGIDRMNVAHLALWEAVAA